MDSIVHRENLSGQHTLQPEHESVTFDESLGLFFADPTTHSLDQNGDHHLDPADHPTTIGGIHAHEHSHPHHTHEAHTHEHTDELTAEQSRRLRIGLSIGALGSAALGYFVEQKGFKLDMPPEVYRSAKTFIPDGFHRFFGNTGATSGTHATGLHNFMDAGIHTLRLADIHFGGGDSRKARNARKLATGAMYMSALAGGVHAAREISEGSMWNVNKITTMQAPELNMVNTQSIVGNSSLASVLVWASRKTKKEREYRSHGLLDVRDSIATGVLAPTNPFVAIAANVWVIKKTLDLAAQMRKSVSTGAEIHCEHEHHNTPAPIETTIQAHDHDHDHAEHHHHQEEPHIQGNKWSLRLIARTKSFGKNLRAKSGEAALKPAFAIANLTAMAVETIRSKPSYSTAVGLASIGAFILYNKLNIDEPSSTLQDLATSLKPPSVAASDSAQPAIDSLPTIGMSESGLDQMHAILSSVGDSTFQRTDIDARATLSVYNSNTHAGTVWDIAENYLHGLGFANPNDAQIDVIKDNLLTHNSIPEASAHRLQPGTIINLISPQKAKSLADFYA